MAESNEPQNDTQLVVVATEDMAIRAVNKRYEGLSMVRAKASKGKGAWYWAYLEPILVRNPETDDPKAVKLRCNLCEAVFSASNPSRTASEHLKRGTCPNFNTLLKHPSPSSSLPPLSSPSSHSNRKRPGSIGTPNEGLNSNYHQQFHHHNHHHHHHHHQHLLLSGGKDDLGPLAMLEDSVKKLKSPKPLPPGPILSKSQIDSALGLLTDWFYESYGSVSFPSFDHPKFAAFLNQVGLPEISRHDFISSRLDSKYEEAKLESEAKIRDAEFYQLSSNGWKIKTASGCGEEGMNMIKFMVNLPNGTTLFRNTFFPSGAIPATYAEEIMWETVTGTCNIAQKCVGIVADKYKSKALRNLELQNHWMINLSCQLQGVGDLIKDFSKDFPLFKNVISNCSKLTNLFNNNSHARSILTKFDSRFSVSFGVPPFLHCENLQNFSSITAMLDNIMSCARVLQLVVMDDLYKVLVMEEEEEEEEDSLATEVADMVQNMGFWNDVEAINTLVKVVKGMVEEIEIERPLVGQCLPLWEDLKAKIKDWCVKFNIPVTLIERIVEKRFKKNYHPAWSTAFILDPVYLMRDESGKYLPPFKCLTCEQEKDVDKLITRLVSREEEEEGQKALMELMKWRSEGLDPLYAQAVQVKQRDPLTGKMKMANPQSSRLVWETILKDFKILGKIAVRLLFLHATSSRFKCNSSLCGNQGQFQSRIGFERVQKMVFIAAHSKLKRGEFGSEDEKEAMTNGDDDDDHDMLNEVFVDAHSL